MARIALTQAGAAIGQRILPRSFQVLGRQISGASIGRRLGRFAADTLEDALTPPSEGPRLDTLQIMESREGAGISNVYGRMRVPGQLIWAGDFSEQRETRGGKGGPRVNSYTYTVSFAVGICEGPNARVDRIWANGELLETGLYSFRTYSGSEDQQPDPAIEAELGTGKAPAYRGLCYIVFEDFPLEAFGNRIPNLSFEVVRSPGGATGSGITDHVKAVNMIPATGEFVYATQPVSVRTFPGREVSQNVHTADGRADFLVALDQLQAELPRVEAVSLTVGWFGDDLRAGHCTIRPGVETRERETVPITWRAGDVGRNAAHLISRDETGNSYYGGTPSDLTVVQAMREMAMRGFDVSLTPFLLMDIPPQNPKGQPAFPWRGRISSGSDGDAAAADDVAAFLGAAARDDFRLDDERVVYSGDSSDWGYRRFILHLAWLAKASGVCSAFLIGSEMRDLTRTRSGAGVFPYVQGLVDLAADVKAILGARCAVSYAADWSEYGAFAPADGTNDVYFPLDPLWGSPDIDFVGIDWYPPSGDWRDGDTHLDRVEGASDPGELAYIVENQTGGEGFDWYYASPADRDAQVRSPIQDTAHGEDWVFRSKDVLNWWGQPHYPRPAGARSESPTPWVPGSKPIRFNEIGFPAVDKGTNSPNLFFDPKSDESAVPPYSSGARDDVLQANALVGALSYWQDQSAIEQAVVWAWDARPFPAFPSRSDVWSDGGNWSYGHWLNGRTGLTSLPLVVGDLAQRADVDIDTANLRGLVEGFALSGVMELDTALAPLVTAYGLKAVETETNVSIRVDEIGATSSFDWDTATSSPVFQRYGERPAAGRLHLAHASFANAFQVELAEAQSPDGDPRRVLALELPMSFSEAEAERVAEQILADANTFYQFEVTRSALSGHLEVGATIELEGKPWAVVACERGLEDTLRLAPQSTVALPLLGVSAPLAPNVPPAVISPDLLVIDGPRFGEGANPMVTIASFADPWAGRIELVAGDTSATLAFRAWIDTPSLTGCLTVPLDPGVLHRWDEASTVEAEFAFAGLSSADPLAVLSGANMLLVETTGGWECLSFRFAELIGPSQYRLSGLLRGQKGTDRPAQMGAQMGARCVVVDDALVRVPLANDDVGRALFWRLGDQGSPVEFAFENTASKPMVPAHSVWRQADGQVSWSARDHAISNEWDAPEPVLDLTYEIESIAPTGEIDVSQHAQAPVAVAQGSVPQRLRAVSKSGRVSDWVPIRAA